MASTQNHPLDAILSRVKQDPAPLLQRADLLVGQGAAVAADAYGALAGEVSKVDDDLSRWVGLAAVSAAVWTYSVELGTRLETLEDRASWSRWMDGMGDLESGLYDLHRAAHSDGNGVTPDFSAVRWADNPPVEGAALWDQGHEVCEALGRLGAYLGSGRPDDLAAAVAHAERGGISAAYWRLLDHAVCSAIQPDPLSLDPTLADLLSEAEDAYDIDWEDDAPVTPDRMLADAMEETATAGATRHLPIGPRVNFRFPEVSLGHANGTSGYCWRRAEGESIVQPICAMVPKLGHKTILYSEWVPAGHLDLLGSLFGWLRDNHGKIEIHDAEHQTLFDIVERFGPFLRGARTNSDPNLDAQLGFFEFEKVWVYADVR